MITTHRSFDTAPDAVSWLCKHSGLWAGVSEEGQNDLYDTLESEGWASMKDETGALFVALLEGTAAATF